MPLTNNAVNTALAGTPYAGAPFEIKANAEYNTTSGTTIILSPGIMEAKIRQMGEVEAIRSSVAHELGHLAFFQPEYRPDLASVNANINAAIYNKSIDMYVAASRTSEAWSYMLQVVIAGNFQNLVITAPNNANITAQVVAAIKAENNGSLINISPDALRRALTNVAKLFDANGGLQAAQKMAPRIFSRQLSGMNEITEVTPQDRLEVSLDGYVVKDTYREIPNQSDVPVPVKMDNVGSTKHVEIRVDGTLVVDTTISVKNEDLDQQIDSWEDAVDYTNEFGTAWQEGGGWGGGGGGTRPGDPKPPNELFGFTPPIHSQAQSLTIFMAAMPNSSNAQEQTSPTIFANRPPQVWE